MAWWKPSLSRLKNAPLIGALAAGAVVAPFVVGSLRSDRRYNPDDLPPMPKDLSDPLPAVMQYTPPAIAAPTLDGQPIVEGAFAQKEKMRRGGLSAGTDITSPNTLNSDGVSMIDGKHVKDLSAGSSMSGGMGTP